MPPAVTIADFAPGTLHQSARVAALFGVTADTIRNWIGRGTLRAVTPVGSHLRLIPGEAVLALWAAAGLPTPGPAPSPSRERANADAAHRRATRARKGNGRAARAKA